MQRITPCLWFDTQAEEAVQFYTSTIPNSSVGKVACYGEGAPLPAGTVLTIAFTLDGQDFLALNGGPHFQFTPAISLVVNCESQTEVDRYWEKMSEGGRQDQCGWLTDKFGMSWQIVPTVISEMMTCGDAARTGRVMASIMTMKKLDIEMLQEAFEGE